MSIYKSIEVAGQRIDVPTAEDILAWLKPYKVNLTDKQVARIQTYIAVLLFWNQKINLTSISDLREIVCRHFGESLYFFTRIPVSASRLADIGSGAGFPGLPLAIARDELQVLLIEQDTRKSSFLNEVVRRLEVENAKVLRSNYHALPSAPTECDVIAARALGNYKELAKWAAPRLSKGGMLALWVGGEDAIKIARIKNWNWDLPLPLPESKKSVIITGSPSI